MRTKRPGQILVEVMMGIAVMTVALLALVQISTKSVNNSGFSKRQSVATAYAKEAMEWLRQQRAEEGWDQIYSRGSGGSGRTYTLNSFPANLSGMGAGCSGVVAGTEYTRCVTVVNSTSTGPGGVNVDVANITIVVSWNEGNRQAAVRQETALTQN